MCMSDERNATRLLVVEDDSDAALLLDAHLRKSEETFETRRVENEDSFRRELESFKPDAILSDYTMPGFDGLKALAIARREKPDTPFIFFSGTIGEERAVDALKRGASDYVSKDRPARLLPALERSLREVRERAAHDRLRRSRMTFGPFVTPELTDKLPGEGAIASERKVMTVLSMDLRGFAGYAGRAEPADVLDAVSETYQAISACVAAEGGIVHRMVGDGAVALFGGPLSLEDHARAAARAALRIRYAVACVSEKRAPASGSGFSVSIGIDTGELVAGILPAFERYAAIGRALDFAERYERACGPGDILLGPGTAAMLRDTFVLRPRGEGWPDALEPFELLRERPRPEAEPAQ